MIYIFGHRLFGKVDHVPGMSYVVTRYFHIQFIPLVPLQAYLVFDDAEGKRGVPLRSYHLLSMAMAYLRAVLVLLCIACACILVFTTVTVIEGTTEPLVAVLYLSAMVCSFLFLWLSYRVTCHSPSRARRLLERAGIRPDLVDDLLNDYEIKLRGPQPRPSSTGSLRAAPENRADGITSNPTTGPQSGGTDSRFSKDTHS